MIKLNNKNLANYVEFKLDKLDNNFTEDELLKIEEVVIDFKVETDSIKNILEDVLKLKNIMSLTIRNGYISKEACKMLMNLKKLNDKKASEAHKKELDKQKAKEIAEKINKLELELKVKAGENGKIFGGITAKEISEELKKQNNIEVDKKKIVLLETIKTLGKFTIDIKLYEGITAKLTIDIKSE